MMRKGGGTKKDDAYAPMLSSRESNPFRTPRSTGRLAADAVANRIPNRSPQAQMLRTQLSRDTEEQISPQRPRARSVSFRGFKPEKSAASFFQDSVVLDMSEQARMQRTLDYFSLVSEDPSEKRIDSERRGRSKKDSEKKAEQENPETRGVAALSVLAQRVDGRRVDSKRADPKRASLQARELERSPSAGALDRSHSRGLVAKAVKASRATEAEMEEATEDKDLWLEYQQEQEVSKTPKTPQRKRSVSFEPASREIHFGDEIKAKGELIRRRSVDGPPPFLSPPVQEDSPQDTATHKPSKSPDDPMEMWFSKSSRKFSDAQLDRTLRTIAQTQFEAKQSSRAAEGSNNLKKWDDLDAELRRESREMQAEVSAIYAQSATLEKDAYSEEEEEETSEESEDEIFTRRVMPRKLSIKRPMPVELEKPKPTPKAKPTRRSSGDLADVLRDEIVGEWQSTPNSTKTETPKSNRFVHHDDEDDDEDDDDDDEAKLNRAMLKRTAARLAEYQRGSSSSEPDKSFLEYSNIIQSSRERSVSPTREKLERTKSLAAISAAARAVLEGKGQPQELPTEKPKRKNEDDDEDDHDDEEATLNQAMLKKAAVRLAEFKPDKPATPAQTTLQVRESATAKPKPIVERFSLEMKPAAAVSAPIPISSPPFSSPMDEDKGKEEDVKAAWSRENEMKLRAATAAPNTSKASAESQATTKPSRASHWRQRKAAIEAKRQGELGQSSGTELETPSSTAASSAQSECGADTPQEVPKPLILGSSTRMFGAACEDHAQELGKLLQKHAAGLEAKRNSDSSSRSRFAEELEEERARHKVEMEAERMTFERRMAEVSEFHGARMQEALTKQKQEDTERYRQLEAAKESVEAENAALHKCLADKDSDIDNLQQLVEGLETDIAENREIEQGLEAENADLRDSALSLEADNRALTDHIESRGSEIVAS